MPLPCSIPCMYLHVFTLLISSTCDQDLKDYYTPMALKDKLHKCELPVKNNDHMHDAVNRAAEYFSSSNGTTKVGMTHIYITQSNHSDRSLINTLERCPLFSLFVQRDFVK